MRQTAAKLYWQSPFLAGAMLLLWVISPTPAGAQEGVTAAPLREFRFDDPNRPMRLPTDVATTHDGRVIVLDGVHDRVLVFDASGGFQQSISTFGGEPLRQPVGLNIAADGRWCIADSGAGRVLLIKPDGTLDRVLPLPAAAEGRSVDPTDAVLSADGRSLWVADNDNHRVGRFDLQAGTWEFTGRLGSGLGQFEYPFQLALAGDDVLVSDVINARAQLLNRSGAAVLALGAYGVDIGQFHRPSGVAVDGAGRCWVADRTTGAIQLFRSDGTFIDAVRDPNGAPLRLESPLGIAFDRGGNLLVAESSAHRARLFALTQSPPVAKPAAAPPGGFGQQAKACTICHIEWLPSLAQGRHAELLPNPGGGRDDPPVARSDACLSCHDGSVADSRARVWDEHGHRTGVGPPATMTVPAHLPLHDGKLACRTCHSAHSTDAPQGDIRRAVGLRVSNQHAELCVSCHMDKTRGPRLGTHPTGGMPWAVPDALITAGARAAPNSRELTCQVCHTPHGAKNDHLLVLGTSSNQLCVTCHDQMRPGMFRDGAHAEHPLTAIVNSEQAEAVRTMGGKLGPQGQLVCLSCHKLHEGHGARFLLADELVDGRMCLRCHAPRREMLGSAHDLRVGHSQERNRLGLTPVEGGPCSSCHLFHRFARTATPTPVDPVGQCATCHQPGQCAQNKPLSDVNHPAMSCSECHNPHETRFPSFLKARPQDLCAGCHSEQAALVGGAHDVAQRPAAWCDANATQSDRCLACHRPHGDPQGSLFRVAPAPGAAAGDAACLGCHPDADPDSGAARALRHPSAGLSAGRGAHLPRIAAHEGAERIGCRTCHDPHGGAGATGKLLRSEGNRGFDLCIACHTDMQSILATSHSPASLAQHGLASAACAPCHQIHGDAQHVQSRLLWPKELLGAGVSPASPEEAATMQVVSDPLCVECHRSEGPADRPAIAVHPQVAMVAWEEAPGGGGFPLFHASGERDAHGAIACRTCHNPHGRNAGETLDATIPGIAVLAQRPQLRPFAVPNTCTLCHGADALRRFLYFHDADRRSGTR